MSCTRCQTLFLSFCHHLEGTKALFCFDISASGQEHIILFSKCNMLAILRGSNDLTDGINEYKICIKSSAFMQVSSHNGMVISMPSWDLNLFVWYSLPWRWRGGLKSSTYSLWERSVIRQTQRVLSDSPHILHSGYDLLPSGRCWRVPHCWLKS